MNAPSCFRFTCFWFKQRLPLLFLCLTLLLPVTPSTLAQSEEVATFPILVSTTSFDIQIIKLVHPPSDGRIRFTIENRTIASLTFDDLSGKPDTKVVVPAGLTQTVTAAFKEQATYLLRDDNGKVIRKWRFSIPSKENDADYAHWQKAWMAEITRPRAAILPPPPTSRPEDASPPGSVALPATTGSDNPPPPGQPTTNNQPPTEKSLLISQWHSHHDARRPTRRSPSSMPITAVAAKPTETVASPPQPVTSLAPHEHKTSAPSSIVPPPANPSTMQGGSATTHPTPAKPNPPTETEKAFQPKVLYKSSDEMYLNVPTAYPVDIALNAKGEHKAEQIDFSVGGVSKQPIPVSSAYTLALHDDDGAFKINLAIQQKNETQETHYSTDGVLHWVWTVTPIREGEHILNLSISGPHGEFLFPARTIHVRVKNPVIHLLSQLPDFMKDNWLWISGVAAALWSAFLVLSGRKKPD